MLGQSCFRLSICESCVPRASVTYSGSNLKMHGDSLVRWMHAAAPHMEDAESPFDDDGRRRR